MPTLRKSLRRKFWHNQAQKPPTLACIASEAIDGNSTCSSTSVKSPSHKTRPIPALLIKCNKEIQARGLVTEGIFRRSGNTALIEKLLKEFGDVDDTRCIDLSTVPIHTLTGLFKRYLQQLSEPVIPKLFQPELLNAYESTPDIQEKLRRINAACQVLPGFHGNLLLFVVHFAHTVSCHADKNKMSPENLSIIFAPTCVRLDGVGQLLSNSSSSSMEKVKSSPMQKPVKMFRTLSLRKANRTLVPPRPSASQATLTCDKISPHSFGNRLKPLFSSMQNGNRSQQQSQQQQRPIPKYEPRDLLQLSLVKESGRWNKFFQFMIENAPKFNYTRHYSTASSLEDQQMAIYNGSDNGVDTILVSTEDETDSNHSLTSPKVRRIKDIFGSMLSMFPDIAQDLNISMSPTTSPTSRTHHSSSARTPPIRPTILNEPEPNVLASPSSGSSFNKRQQKPHHTALLPPPAAATVSRKRNSSDTWTPPMASLRRTMTADTSSGNNNDDEDLESPTRFIGTKYEAIWQHWKEREDEERYIPTLELKTNLNSLRSKGDWLKSLSQNADFAAPATNKRPMSVAFIPSARPNYFLR